MSWEIPLTSFEDEPSESVLIDRFVKYSALYPQVDPLQIGDYVYKGLRDPVLRSSQAVGRWLSDLDVRERIRLAKLNGGEETKQINSKDKRLQQLQTLFEDESLLAKDRIAAAKLIAEMQGEIEKNVNKKTTGERRPISVVYGVYDD